MTKFGQCCSQNTKFYGTFWSVADNGLHFIVELLSATNFSQQGTSQMSSVADNKSLQVIENVQLSPLHCMICWISKIWHGMST